MNGLYYVCIFTLFIYSSAVISNPNAALGFRLHMADIYLEELAKVGGDDLSSKIILELIEPFAKELSEGKGKKHVFLKDDQLAFKYLIKYYTKVEAKIS